MQQLANKVTSDRYHHCSVIATLYITWDRKAKSLLHVVLENYTLKYIGSSMAQTCTYSPLTWMCENQAHGNIKKKTSLAFVLCNYQSLDTQLVTL